MRAIEAKSFSGDDGPDLEMRAHVRLFPVRPIAGSDRRGVARDLAPDRQRIRQADCRAGLSAQRGPGSSAARAPFSEAGARSE
jgi:hypothetical protein